MINDAFHNMDNVLFTVPEGLDRITPAKTLKKQKTKLQSGFIKVYKQLFCFMLVLDYLQRQKQEFAPHTSFWSPVKNLSTPLG